MFFANANTRAIARPTGGGALSAVADDFESYATGNFTLDGDWEQLGNDNASQAIIAADAYAPMTSQHLKVTGTANGTSHISFVPSGSTVTDGTLDVEVVMEAFGSSNNQPGAIIRHSGVADYIEIRLDKNTSKLSIFDYVSGSAGITSSAYTFSDAVVYYLRVVATGTSIVVSIYSDAERTIQLATVTDATAVNATGKVGLHNTGLNGNLVHFDNFNWAAA